MPDVKNVLTIQQLTPSSTFAELHKLELGGFAGPKGQIDWGEGTQRGDVEWYSGSGVGTPTLTGPEEGVGQFNLMLKGRLSGGTLDALYDGEPLVDIDELERVIDEMRQASVLVSVTWRKQTRVGYIVGWHPLEGRLQEYEGTLRVQWVAARGARRAARPIATDLANLHAEVAEDWNARLDTVGEPFTFPRLTAEGIADKIDGATDKIDALGALARDTARGDVRAAGVLTASLTGQHQVARKSSEVVASLAGAGRAVVDVAGFPLGETTQTDDPAARLDARLYQARVGRAGWELQVRAARERRFYEARADDGVLAVHEAIRNETIYELALAFYQDVTGAELISRANQLASPVLAAGQRVIIPRRGRRG